MAKLDERERPRRFYRQAAAGPAAGGHGVLLDGRPAKTPGGAHLTAPTRALAELIAAEWEAQDKVIAFSAMPATRLAFTAIDRADCARAGVAREIARFAAFDLVCQIADQPAELAAGEEASWGPWRAWAADELGVRLMAGAGLSAPDQPAEALDRVEALALALEPMSLAGLAFASALYGSAVLALAVQQGALDAGEAFELSRLEEAWQEARWGVDAEAAARTERLRGEAAMIGAWFEALRAGCAA